MQRLLLVDASYVVRRVGVCLFKELGFSFSEASNVQEAKEFCKKSLPNYIIVDAAIEDSLEFISYIRTDLSQKNIIIYYMLVEVDLEKMQKAAGAGVTDFLLKPFNRKILSFIFRNFSNSHELPYLADK
ncbi:putative two-component response regulator transcriptional regulatory protein [Liberibacter crescens BT-1]|uniref:Putative two-component response regulator transcriptional regulatory protein n=1 Tax=Liberibacter crescens (strain BT-1) TaxID=1215343 RepID=L0EW14_LIBCB|nr:response regulator [Liberibacter crescens]AGA65025.1 putative two-component response regulator transcriptional regulatory protein [Liberibacter crescens BT-1]AMC13031.1 hypothetical protein RL73_05250 [Liberibacter crescens]